MYGALLGLLGGLLGDQGNVQRSSPRTSNLDSTQMNQLMQAKQLAPAGTEIKPPEMSTPEASQGGGFLSGNAGTALSLLGGLAGQQGQVSQSNIAQTKQQKYNQMLQSLMSNRSVNNMDIMNMMRYLQ
jgi:hypothetical protein